MSLDRSTPSRTILTVHVGVLALSGMEPADPTLLRAALRAIQSRTMPAVGDNVDLRLTAFGEDDVLLGAAMLVLDRELGVA